MPTRLDASITSWPALIRWLADQHHDGRFYPMAARAKVSAGLIDQWKRGVVKTPTLDSIVKVCSAYNLELEDLLRFSALGDAAPDGLRVRTLRRRPRPIGGGSTADGTPLVPFAEAVSFLSDAVLRWLSSLWGWPRVCVATV